MGMMTFREAVSSMPLNVFCIRSLSEKPPTMKMYLGLWALLKLSTFVMMFLKIFS